MLPFRVSFYLTIHLLILVPLRTWFSLPFLLSPFFLFLSTSLSDYACRRCCISENVTLASRSKSYVKQTQLRLSTCHACYWKGKLGHDRVEKPRFGLNRRSERLQLTISQKVSRFRQIFTLIVADNRQLHQ